MGIRGVGMGFSSEVLDKYRNLLDVNERGILSSLEVEVGTRVLCVGCCDSVLPNMFAESGCQVVGVDLREYNTEAPCNFEYIRGDFCDLVDFHYHNHQTFDLVLCLGSIEFFGMGNYGEGRWCEAYDALASRKFWDALKVGGMAYIGFPVGKNYVSNPPHWRIYDMASVVAKLVQDFEVVGCGFYCTVPMKVADKAREMGEIIALEEAMNYPDPHAPLVRGIIKLRKNAVTRQAPSRQLAYKLPPETAHLYNHDRPIIVTEWTPRPNEVCVDVGTGTGTWSLAALARGAKVIVFEPCIKYVNMLMQASTLNGYSNLSIIPAGLSDGVGVASFNAHDGVFEPGQNAISVTTLDGYWENNPYSRLDYVNMDVEGHELHVIRGAKHTLSKYRPKVIVEVHTSMGVSFEDVEKEMRAVGYSKFRRTPEFLIADGR